MASSLKTYLNRCRCCLEPFESNEDPAQITDFFEIQYYAFTRVELKPHDLLSKYVCEYCHLELVRFSVWKKDLIEKQKQLYTMLDQHIQEELEHDSDDGEIFPISNNNNSILEISDEELAGSDFVDDHKNGKMVIVEEDELVDTDNDGSTEMNEESTDNNNDDDDDDDDDDETYITTENASDSDYALSRSMINRTKLKVKPATTLKSNDLRCEICKSTFLGRQGLVRHVQFCKPGAPVNKKRKRSERNGKFRCFCKVRFISHRALNIHRTRAHGKNSNMSWDFVSDNNDNLSLPEVTKGKVQNQNNNTSKDNNPKSTSSKSNGTREKKKMLKCKYCSFRSTNNIVIFNHMRRNHLEAIKQPECVECNKSFSCTAALRVHINDIHLAIRPHTCVYCKSNFKQLAHLKDHMLSIHKALHKPYCCACGASFCTLKTLKLHKLQEHKIDDGDVKIVLKEVKVLPPVKTLGGRYICVCTREFAYPSRLSEHQRYCKLFKKQEEEAKAAKSASIITEEFQCFKCLREFNNRSNLIRHQKSSGHLDAKQLKSLKFQCNHCKQKFFSPESLGKHVKNSSCQNQDSD